MSERLLRVRLPATVNGTLETIVGKGVGEAAIIVGEAGLLIADAIPSTGSPAAIRQAVEQAAARAFVELDAVVHRAIMHGVMLGALDNAEEVETNDEIKPAPFFEGAADFLLATSGFAGQQYQTAVSEFLALKPFTRKVFDTLDDKARLKAFTVAGASKRSVVRTVQRELARQIARGADLRDFRDHVVPRLERAGWSPKNSSHVENVLRTNVARAYSAGRVEHAMKPSVLKHRPIWELVGVQDGPPRQRASHQKAHGMGMRATNPEWAQIYTPAGWSCRCIVRTTTEKRARNLVASILALVPDFVDKGFRAGVGALLAPDPGEGSPPPAATPTRPAAPPPSISETAVPTTPAPNAPAAPQNAPRFVPEHPVRVDNIPLPGFDPSGRALPPEALPTPPPPRRPRAAPAAAAPAPVPAAPTPPPTPRRPRRPRAVPAAPAAVPTPTEVAAPTPPAPRRPRRPRAAPAAAPAPVAGAPTSPPAPVKPAAPSKPKEKPKLEDYRAARITTRDADLLNAVGEQVVGQAITPEIIHGIAGAEKFPEGYRAHYEVRAYPGHGTPSITISTVVRTPEGQEAATINRTVKRTPEGKLHVDNDYFVIKEQYRGKGVGAKVIAEQIKHYQEIGVDRIELHAAWDGQYAWPRMGYKLMNPNDLVVIKAQFRHWLTQKKLYELAEAQAVADRAADIHELATTVDEKGNELGKEFLVWRGNSSGLGLINLEMHVREEDKGFQRMKKYLRIDKPEAVKAAP